MALTKKCTRIVELVRAVRLAGEIAPGDKVQMPHEQPATYIGPVMEDEIQMHEFRLFAGTRACRSADGLRSS
jgi:hypothetical protein